MPKVKKFNLTNTNIDEVKRYIGNNFPIDLPELFVEMDNGNLFFPYKDDKRGETRLNWSTRKNGNKDARVAIIL